MIPLLLNFMCRRFETLCSVFIVGVSRKKNWNEIVLVPGSLSPYTAYEDGTDGVPKRRNIKFRRRGITQRENTTNIVVLGRINCYLFKYNYVEQHNGRSSINVVCDKFLSGMKGSRESVALSVQIVRKDRWRVINCRIALIQQLD